jgi:hypothetical protein
MKKYSALIVAYNKPAELKELVKRLVELDFSKIYIFVDAPSDVTNTKCQEVKDFVSSLDDDRYIKLYADVNLGSARGPLTAFSWFFTIVEEGFVFEEDCLPIISHFKATNWQFLSEVDLVCFSNFSANGNKKNIYTSIIEFKKTKFFNSWGWFSNREMVGNLISKLESSNAQIYTKVTPVILSRHFEYLNFISNEKERISWWDFQFISYLMANNVSILRPTINMIENVGCGVEGASHTFGALPNVDANKKLNIFFCKFLDLFLKDKIYVSDLINWLKFGPKKYLIYTFFSGKLVFKVKKLLSRSF